MPHKFGINSPPSVKHISQKAFFKHALRRVFLAADKALKQEAAEIYEQTFLVYSERKQRMFTN